MTFLRWILSGGRITRYRNTRDELTTNPAFCLIDSVGVPSINFALDEVTRLDRFVYWLFC